MRKTGRGITIVSLVVTIIILLILATVSIQSLTHTGMFASANKAKLDTKRSQISEWLGLEVISEQTNNPTGSAEQIINQTHKNVLDKQEELKRFGKDIKVEDVSTEEDGEQVDVYFYVVVDKDIYKVDLKNHKFIGELGKMLPVIKIVSISNTTNSIKVKVKTSRNEGGIVEYYIKSEDDTRYTLKATKNDDSEYVYDNLIQGKKYSVKVVAKAENGQSAEAIAEQTTGTIINLKEGDLEFTSKPSTWTNTDVEVTVKANIDIKGYQLLTSQNPDKGWNKATSQIFKTNGIIYAVLSDGVNYGVAASRTIQNIDKTKPVVTGATATTNKIAITATDEASGIIGYAVTTSNTTPSSFTDVASTKTLSVAPTGYRQGTTYYVWVKDAAGNVSASKSTATGKVTDLTAANVKFTYSPSGWTNKDVTATASTTVTGFTLQTSKDGSNWSSTATQTYSSNGKIYARLWDGTNFGATATGNFTNIDKTKPVVTGATATTNKIAITATDEASGIIGYAVTTSNTTPSSFTDVASTKTLSVAPTGYRQGTTYYVWVKDAAGNVSASKSTATGKVTDLTAANVKFTYSPSGWTNKDVTATASTTVTGFTLQTSKDGSNWSSTATQTYSSNGKIYARLWDGTNFGATATGNFTNIDKTKPVVTGATATTNKIAITATDEASGIIGYAVTTSNTTPSSFTDVASTKTLSVAPTGYRQGTTYYVWVKDAAGNVSASKSTATGKVTDLTAANVKFTYSPSGWTNKDVTATASTTVTGFTLQTSKDGSNWSSTATQTYSSNGKIYARLWDGTNFGATATGNFTNIDKTKPVVTGATATTNKIAITATDEASGIIGYAVTTSNTTPSSFTDVASTKTLSVAPTGYKQGTTYYVWVKDEAGNVSESETVTTLNVTGTINFGAITWAGGKASTTIGTNTSYTIQYQVNSTTGTWKTGTSVNGLVHGDKVYARLWDGTNGGTSFAINNILDGINPSVNINLSATEVTTEGAITATVTQSDSESGINIGSCKWIYNTTAGNIGTNASSYTGTFTSANQNITLKSTTVGTYYLHVLSADNAGNLKETIKGPIAVKTASNAVPGSTTHTPSAITYSWADLATIAQLISSNTNITSDTAEVTVTLNGATKTLGVGDTTTVDGKTVRILGFNHDTLTDSNAYGTKTATGKAGISFEYVDFVTSNSQMNASGRNYNGWAAMPLRTTLNGTVYDSLSIKNYIKAVNKEYITTYNTGAKSTCSDKLWLLSCGEIWNNGYNGGNTRGYAMATEGSQYKYYKSTLGSTAYNTSTNITKKPNASNSYYWWLRSPNFYDSYTFCVVFSSGYCASSYAYYSFGVAPGFSI